MTSNANDSGIPKFAGIKWRKTESGFRVGRFDDQAGRMCSLQESSATSERCIWLGLTTAEPLMKPSGGHGWTPVKLNQHIVISTRMHLNQAQAAELAKVLQHFADTGELPP